MPRNLLFLLLLQLLSFARSQQVVEVGGQGLQFLPNTIYATVGSTVKFQFVTPGHTVTEGAYDNPCMPLASSSFYSGMLDVNKVFTVTINDTNPIWFYCSTPGHCQAGMVGVINPGSSSNTLNGYRSAAGNAGTSSQPDSVQGGVIQDGSAVSSSNSASGSTTATSTASSTSSTAKSDSTRVTGSSKFGALVAVAGMVAAGLLGW